MKKIIFFLPLFFLLPFYGGAYGVLTHEAVIDAAWANTIVPLLREKFPAADSADLHEAHAYAYGGAVAPDMGYYPFGTRLFTDLVHYVRSGDMVTALLRNAQTLNGYAFALGFLSHYYADKYGHPLGTNVDVPLIYPSVESKFGTNATYAEDEIAHVRMEFAFDVLEVAKGNYVPQSYRDYIGFKVDTALLSRAFTETYGLDLNILFKHHLGRAVSSFRWVVANLFPFITKSAWAEKKKFILKNDSTATAARFSYRMKRATYKTQFDREQKPGPGATIFSFLVRILPKIGPLKALKFKAPNAVAEKNFDRSFDSVLHYYTLAVGQSSRIDFALSNIDFDTGSLSSLCEYPLTGITYEQWISRLAKFPPAARPAAVTADVRNMYASVNRTLPGSAGKRCRRLFAALRTF